MLEEKSSGLNMGEKMVFLLILALFEKREQVTVFDVKQANKNVKQCTTEKIISNLTAKGYLSKTRSNQYFSRTYLTVTEKGLLLARSFRVAFASLSSLG